MVGVWVIRSQDNWISLPLLIELDLVVAELKKIAPVHWVFIEELEGLTLYEFGVVRMFFHAVN